LFKVNFTNFSSTISNIKNMAGFYTCGPNECIVLSGVFHDKNPKTVVGGRCFKLPWIQQVQRLSLNVHTLSIKSENVYTKLGVSNNVSGVAQVKSPNR